MNYTLSVSFCQIHDFAKVRRNYLIREIMIDYFSTELYNMIIVF